MQVGACAFQVDAVLLVLGIAGIDGVLACGAAHAVQHFLAVDVMGVGGFTAQGVVRFFGYGIPQSTHRWFTILPPHKLHFSHRGTS